VYSENQLSESDLLIKISVICDVRKFDEVEWGSSTRTEAKISLRKSGSIGINQAAINDYFADDDGAVLYFDKDINHIGIEPVGDSDADDAAYTVSKAGSGGTIAGQALLNKYGLTPDVTTQYNPIWDDDHDFIIVDLSDPLGTYGSPDNEDDTDQ
jgi:hypothetical protein